VVTSVTWTNRDTGGSGTATGTTRWSASVPIRIGGNLIVVTAWDQVGNAGRDSIQVTFEGNTRSWGANWAGQLGNATTLHSYTPVGVTDPADPTGLLQNVIEVTSSGRHSLAVLADGTLWGWGENDQGQLGDGTTTNRLLPVQVGDVLDPSGHLTGVVSAVTGTEHSVALLRDGTVRTWGLNGRGQLGDGTTTFSVAPVRVVDPPDPSGFLQDVAAVAAGGEHSLALLGNGTIRSWGANILGQLGDLSRLDRLTPSWVIDLTDPSGLLTNVSAISAGRQHSAALISDGTVRSWGDGRDGQLGDNSGLDFSEQPVQVVDPTDPSGLLRNVTAIALGARHTMARLVDGTVRAWGSNLDYQLGTGSGLNSFVPAQILDLSDPTGYLTGVEGIGAGESGGIAVKGTGTVWTWGGWGSILPEQVADPADPTGFLTGVSQIEAGTYLFVVQLADGTVRTWGLNDRGQLGDGTSTEPCPSPVLVVSSSHPSGVLRADKARAGWAHSAALLEDGTVRTWGDNSRGQLGDGTYLQRSEPVPVVDPSGSAGYLAGVADLDVSHADTLVILVDGTVRGWGPDQGGPHPAPIMDPTDPTGFLTGVTGIACGGAEPRLYARPFALALKSDGTVRGWGHNSYGQLGDGSGRDAATPVQTVDSTDPAGVLTGIVDVDAGQSHSVGLKVDGTVRAWGGGAFGQLGVGMAGGSYEPLQVEDPDDPTGYLTNVAAIYAGGRHTVALMADGTLRTWGDNSYGQLGDGTTTRSLVPVQVVDPSDPCGFLTGVRMASASYGTTLAVMLDGTVRAWGQNDFGHLGDGTLTSSPTPVIVTDPTDPTGILTGVKSVSAGVYHTIAVR
jgi:alpha-tubulin suppressor-like RCC1 family protein